MKALIYLCSALVLSFSSPVLASEIKPITFRIGYFNLGAVEADMKDQPAEKTKVISTAIQEVANGKVDLVLDGAGVYRGGQLLMNSGIDLTDSIRKQLNLAQSNETLPTVPAMPQTLRMSYFNLYNVEYSIPSLAAANSYIEQSNKELLKMVDDENASIKEAKAQGQSLEQLKQMASEMQKELNQRVNNVREQASARTKPGKELVQQAISRVADRHKLQLIVAGQSVFMGGNTLVENSSDLTDELIADIKLHGEHPESVASTGQHGTVLKAPDLNSDIETLSKQIAQDPQNEDLYLSRAILYFATSEQLPSYEDSKKVLDIISSKSTHKPSDEYKQQMAIILMCLFSERNNPKSVEDALLKKAQQNCNKNQWPYPLIKYLSGELSETAILTSNKDEQAEKSIIIGFRQLIKGKTALATANFRAAQELSVTQNKLAGTDYKKIATAMLSVLSH